MQFTNHGGGCCGIMHIQGMEEDPDEPNSNRLGETVTGSEALLDFLTYLLPEYNRQRVVEVTTSSENNQTENWASELLRQGFRRVCSFYNSNSGNTVTVWHHHPNLTLYGDEPQPQTPITPVPRQEVRPVLIEHCPISAQLVGDVCFPRLKRCVNSTL